MAGREGIPRSSFRTIAILTVLPVAGLLIFFCWLLVRDTRLSLPLTKSSGRRPRASDAVVRAALTPPRPEARGPRPQIVIIIDDIGFDSQRIDRAMAIDPNLNFAVLPNSTRGSEVAERLNQRGFEILCHLPMEPRSARVSPGENAVLTSMSDAQIATATRENIAAVPHARGVNNHMGSRATADRRVMTDVMRAIPRGMYFIDSLTGGRSVAGDVAREMNVKTATRQVFLDDVQTDASVRRQLAELSRTARAKGVAIGIGHPHEVTLRVLAQEVPQLRARGFRFVRASEVVN
ncbi:MAG: hypothetical protein NVSMB68_02670 [Thermoanaerobaculia bacterium]